MQIKNDFTKFLSECDWYEMKNIRGDVTDNYYDAVYIATYKNGRYQSFMKTYDLAWRPVKVFRRILEYYEAMAELI